MKSEGLGHLSLFLGVSKSEGDSPGPLHGWLILASSSPVPALPALLREIGGISWGGSAVELGSGWPWWQKQEPGNPCTLLHREEAGLCLGLPAGESALADGGGSGSGVERGPPALGQLLIAIKKRK